MKKLVGFSVFIYREGINKVNIKCIYDIDKNHLRSIYSTDKENLRSIYDIDKVRFKYISIVKAKSEYGIYRYVYLLVYIIKYIL